MRWRYIKFTSLRILTVCCFRIQQAHGSVLLFICTPALGSSWESCPFTLVRFLVFESFAAPSPVPWPWPLTLNIELAAGCRGRPDCGVKAAGSLNIWGPQAASVEWGCLGSVDVSKRGWAPLFLAQRRGHVGDARKPAFTAWTWPWGFIFFFL